MSRFTTRPATISDIPALVELDQKVWGEDGATKEMIGARIETFQQGIIVALKESTLVGCGVFQYIAAESVVENMTTWEQVTGSGLISTHEPTGSYAYGVNLTALGGAGKPIMSEAKRIITADNKKGLYLGSRAPGFHEWHIQNPTLSLSDYVNSVNTKGRSIDPELRWYLSQGFEIVRILENYFPGDTESEGHGVLIFWKNPNTIA